MIPITIKNFKEHLGKDVDVSITNYFGGVMYPDENILIGMNDFFYYFYSKEEDQYWHFEYTFKEEERCSIEVFSK